MKIKSILALTVFSLYTGITNYSSAQDTKLSFGKYLFATPWTVGGGVSFVSNNGDPNPLVIDTKSAPFGNLNRVNYYPSRFTIEKALVKGFSLQFAFSRHGFQPTNFLNADVVVKYSFNNLFKEAKISKWFDPYAVVGAGITHIYYYRADSVYVNNVKGSTPKKVLENYAITVDGAKDNFMNLTFGIGSNFWINKVVGINLQYDAKTHFLERTARGHKNEGTNYTQFSAGLVFKIGRCKETTVEEAIAPVSNYKRSKEEEDALIHLREHLNK